MGRTLGTTFFHYLATFRGVRERNTDKAKGPASLDFSVLAGSKFLVAGGGLEPPASGL